MTINFTVGDAIAAMSVTAINVTPETLVVGVSTDSRNIQPGELFVALEGENFDGHKFVELAIAKGAVAAVVSTEWSAPEQLATATLLRVDDTVRAYQALACWWRDRCNLPVIAVTGSAGKTTTKELVSVMLSRYTQQGKQVHKSEANHNNDIGVAKTLLAIDPDRHDFVVVEMGMRGRGEIGRLSQTARPNVGVITNIGSAHIGRLGSKSAIAAAKCELLEYMAWDGVAVLNADDELLQSTASGVWQGRTITFGLGVGDVNGDLVENWLQVAGLTFSLPLPGRHNALNFLAALAVVKALGLDWQVLSKGIDSLNLPAGRAQFHNLPNDVVILDETYNASPEAVIAALHLLAETSAQRRWAVLGTMKEMGDASVVMHTQVGKVAKELGIDRLIVLTDGEADAILDGAGGLPLAQGYATNAEVVQELLRSVKSGDRLLFKASRSVGMDQLVKDFQAAWI